MMKYPLLTWGIALMLCSLACHKKDGPNVGNTPLGKPLFTLLPGTETGVRFRNDLVYDRDFNIYRYRNFYNGGGVAIGDVNNDGLPDLFFTSNMAQNRLYLNRGNWKFEDVTDAAGLAGKGSWSTGVAMADIDADGKLDIYVCNSGNPRSNEKKDGGFNRENELFINRGNNANGVPQFEDKAVEFGLADRGLTTHTAFFDYDLDGDLDAYILNNSFRAIGSFDLRKNLRFTRDSLGGHKLFENQRINPRKNNPGNKAFVDVSEEKNILGSVIAFGLGVTVGDADMDGWPDIYVSNDFFEKDYFYHNTGKGGFEEDLEKRMRHISAASMGADMADINNDAYPDIFVTDMLPEPDHRLKTTTSFDSPDRFRYTTGLGYYNQFTRNMLHLNNTNGSYSEIACLAGVEATDWSWGALMTDLDNDGWRDIYVANGIAQDLTNQDYLMFAADPAVQQEIVAGGSVDFKRLIDSIPSEKIPNYAFQNLHNLQFVNRAEAWGLAQPSFSNGSAYGDLDNDGDLDLVVNNANMEAFVYRNEADNLLKNNYLKFELEGEAQNIAAFGAKIFVRTGGQTFYQEQMPVRGFQSSMDPRPNIGLGAFSTIDSVWVVWPTPDQKATLLTGVKANQTLRLKQSEANINQAKLPWLHPPTKPLFANTSAVHTIPWSHQENPFFDWDRDRLLYFRYSTDGPRLAVGDLNGDGLEDFFACGAAGQAGAVLLQTPDGKFSSSNQAALQADAAAEDTDATLFDADGDKDLDLYVASGGNEHQSPTLLLADRLYINDGKGRFTRKNDALPGQKPFATGCVKPADVDGDGDFDLFVGMRLMPAQVGLPMSGFLLINDGNGYFDMTAPPALKNLGLITDACWADLDGDKDPDLLVVGEWMAPQFYRNDDGQLSKAKLLKGEDALRGLWRRIGQGGDFNGDGRPDFLLGNFGLNSRLDASEKQPLTQYVHDFDQNGTTEQILCRYNGGILLPYILRGDMVSNMPFLKKKYLHYRNYANKTMPEIFKPEQLQGASVLEATEFRSAVLLSQADGTYQCDFLPIAAQFAPVFGFCIGDFDGDGHNDALCGGNFTGAKPEFGFMDADYGLFLRGDGKGAFSAIRSAMTGFSLSGEVRDLQRLKIGKKQVVLVARNNASIAVFE